MDNQNNNIYSNDNVNSDDFNAGDNINVINNVNADMTLMPETELIIVLRIIV